MGERRRVKGEGAFFQRHDHPTCPPTVDGKRPAHNCRGTWIGRVDLGWVGGKHVRRQVSGRTRVEVQRKMTQLKRDVEKGAVSTSSTVEVWLEHWFAKIAPARCRPRTLDGYRTYLDQYLIKHLGKHRLSKLTPDHVRAMLATMEAQGLSIATRRQAYAILRRALVVAVRDGRVSRNVCEAMDPPKVPENHHTPLTLAQARKVLRSLDGDPLAARWACALLLGMRQGECLGLKWSDVDMVGGRLIVQRELIRLRGKGLVETPPKSATSLRSIPFGQVPPAVFALERTERRGEYVFYGGKMDPRADWQAWKDLLVRAGVVAEKDAEDNPTKASEMPALHAARTTTGSLLDEAGVSEKIISEILGHSSVQVTQRVYIQGNEDRHREGLGRMAELLALDEP